MTSIPYLSNKRLEELSEYPYSVSGYDIEWMAQELIDARRKIDLLKEDAERLANALKHIANRYENEHPLLGSWIEREHLKIHQQVMKEV